LSFSVVCAGPTQIGTVIVCPTELNTDAYPVTATLSIKKSSGPRRIAPPTGTPWQVVEGLADDSVMSTTAWRIIEGLADDLLMITTPWRVIEGLADVS
jgi:hypothetical protein